MQIVAYKKGDMIIEKDERNNNFFILKKGTLKITEYESETNEDG